MGQILKLAMGKLSILVGLALLAFLAVQATENENKQLSASEDRAVEEGLLRGVRDAGRKKKKAKSKRRKSLGKKKKKSKKKNRPAKKSGKKTRNGKGKKKKSGKPKKKKSMKKRKKSAKKQKKRKQKQPAKKSFGRQEAESDEDMCIKELASLGAIFGNQARNIYRQASRALQFADLKAKKLKKKDDFTASLEAVEAVCKDQDAAAKDPLAACPGEVEGKCTETPQETIDEIQECLDTVNEFRDLFIKEIAKAGSADAICALVMAPATTELKDAVIACKDKILAAEAAQKEEKNACVAAFSDCRKEERNALGQMQACDSGMPTSSSTMASTDGM